MIRFVLRQFGFTICYKSNFGTHTYRYGVLDYIMARPIHRNMTVAPPWAIRHIERIK